MLFCVCVPVDLVCPGEESPSFLFLHLFLPFFLQSFIQTPHSTQAALVQAFLAFDLHIKSKQAQDELARFASSFQ
jgi:hypothetical protein